MLYLFHGDDFAKSRALIVDQYKKLGINSRLEHELTELSPEKIFELTHTPDIFGAPQCLIIDISKAGRMNLEPYLGALTKIPKNTTVIIFASKSLSKLHAFTKNATLLNAKITESIPKPEGHIFTFVDALYAKDRQKTYKELYKLIKDNTDYLYLFSMILYGLRTRIHQLGEEKIKGLFARFYQLDKQAKTGEISSELLVTLAVEKVLN